VTAATDDTAAYLRGKAFLGGIRDDTALSAACDVWTVLQVEGVPGEDIGKWRRRFDPIVWQIKPPDRSSWGLRPDQLQATSRLTGARPPVPGR